MKEKSKPEPSLAVSVREAARLISVTDRYVRKLVERGTLRGVHVGRRLLIPRSALEDLLRASERDSAA